MLMLIFMFYGSSLLLAFDSGQIATNRKIIYIYIYINPPKYYFDAEHSLHTILILIERLYIYIYIYIYSPTALNTILMLNIQKRCDVSKEIKRRLCLRASMMCLRASIIDFNMIIILINLIHVHNQL